jgi:hypothetical protein
VTDYRQPEHRRQTFLHFYEFHLTHRSHPGAVYYLMPYLRDRLGWDEEQALWFAFLNGNTQHPATSLILHRRFPTIAQAAELCQWFDAHRPELEFDTDRRHHRKALPQAVAGYAELVRGAGSQRALWHGAAEGGFSGVWDVATAIPTFGRLSAFSFSEYLAIMGVPVECDTLFMDDIPGSRSHRNGLAIVLGRDDLDWHPSNPGFAGYDDDTIDMLTEEGEKLLAEAREKIDHPDVGYFTMESALCTYKSWHRPNRRYPNVYNDLLFDRLRKAERRHRLEDFDVLWEARRACLPPYLRLEDVPHDPGCVPAKQNYYREHGCPVMMHRAWPRLYSNPFNLAIDTGEAPAARRL